MGVKRPSDDSLARSHTDFMGESVSADTNAAGGRIAAQRGGNTTGSLLPSLFTKKLGHRVASLKVTAFVKVTAAEKS